MILRVLSEIQAGKKKAKVYESSEQSVASAVCVSISAVLLFDLFMLVLQ